MNDSQIDSEKLLNLFLLREEKWYYYKLPTNSALYSLNKDQVKGKKNEFINDFNKRRKNNNEESFAISKTLKIHLIFMSNVELVFLLPADKIHRASHSIDTDQL